MKSVLALACVGASAQLARAASFPTPVDGVVTLTTAGDYSSAIPNGTTKLVVNVNGTAKLTSGTAYTGSVVVKSGATLHVTNKGLLSNAPVTVESGGTLEASFASPGQWVKAFNQPITISGSGNGGIGAFKYSGSGTADSIVKTLVLAADATIDCSKRWGVSNGNGAGTIDLAGHTLKRIGSDNFMFVSATMTPGTFENTAGTITFQNNGSNPFLVKSGCKGEDTVVKMTGGTLSFWTTSYSVPYKVVLDGGKVTANSGNGVPPKNCFGGPVDLNFWLTLESSYMKNSSGSRTSMGFMGPLAIAAKKALQLNNDGTLYVGGPLSGAGELKASNNGLVSLQGEDVGYPRVVMQGGRMELDVDRGCANMFRCANGGSVYGVFRHRRGDLAFVSGDNPRVGESTGSFGAYVFENGTMSPSNSLYLAAEKTGSHAFFRQKGGHFKLCANEMTDSSKRVKAGACNAEVFFVQTGGTNDTLHTRVAANAVTRFDFGACGSTNLLFALSGSNTVFRTDGFNYACATNRTVGVIAVNDGAAFKARRFTTETTRAAGTDVTFCFNGGVLYPLFHSGWANLGSNDANYFKRAPEHTVVFEKGVTIDTSECLTHEGALSSSQLPLLFKAPEGQGIASIDIPADAAAATYYGPVPVEIVGPAGSYGASAYAECDLDAKKLTKIVVTSPGCNYDATTVIRLRSYDCKSNYDCAFTLTGTQKSGGLVKRGPNAAQFNGRCSYTGGTTVEGGMLSMFGAFPPETPLAVRKGATFRAGNSETVRVSRLSGEGTLDVGGGTVVTEALALDADAVFAADATPLTTAKAVTFADGAKVEISLTEAQKAAYKERKRVTVLKATGGIAGTPKLLVNGKADMAWEVRNTGTELQFGYRSGLSVIVR